MSSFAEGPARPVNGRFSGGRRRSAALLLAAAALGSLCVRGNARAEPRPAALGWTRLPGAETCVGSVELAASVEARLGKALLVPPAKATHALEGRVEALEGTGFRAVIVLSDRAGVSLGERTIESASTSCRDLDDALALAVSLLLDPDATEPAPAASAPATAPSAASAPVGPQGSSSSKPPPATASRLARAYAGFGMILGIGMVPGVNADALALGYVTRVTVPFRWVGFDVAVALWPSHPVSDSVSLRATRLQVQSEICGTFAVHPRVALFPCSGVSLGAMNTLSTEVSFDQTIVDLVAELRANIRVVGPFRLGIEAGAHVPLIRWDAQRYFSPPVAATAGVTAGWAFE